uniref:Uncharacterized protein n=1 Tax=Alexandrium monilatum TaxID=311494 RepID=A0A7S4QHY9_9DINO|mmetsp:Transcript_85257/g.254150  ORF Transcript_85257/g.254150 Transcript_85257/m.254150 type:complete len:356 (-) Transcript_85257:241-1308(-)
MSDPAIGIIRTLAKSPHDALKIVASKYGRGFDTEVCRMQLPIGLGGGACSVIFRRGMMMTELRQEVSRVTGIPVDEQMYVASDTTQLVDDDGEVPVGLPPRCLRARGPGRDGSSTPESEPSASELSGSEPSGDAAEEAEVSTSGHGAHGVARAAQQQKAKWADLLDGSEDGECPQDGDSSVMEPMPSASLELAEAPKWGPAGGAQGWAWRFTLRWRRWMPRERQHQFYIAIVDERYLQEHKVAKHIRQACGLIYKEGQVMVRLRGRGSGFLEVKWKGQKWESADPLMICLSGRVPYDLEAYWLAFYQISQLLEDVYAAYNRQHRHAQDVHLDDEWVHSGRRVGGRKFGQAPRARR